VGVDDQVRPHTWRDREKVATVQCEGDCYKCCMG
jgi:hypothetical protein